MLARADGQKRWELIELVDDAEALHDGGTRPAL
jgi:hypothetical protein